MTDVVTLFITTASQEEARKVARAVLDKKRAACVNIIPGVRSAVLVAGQPRGGRGVAPGGQDAGLPWWTSWWPRSSGPTRTRFPEIIAMPVVAGNPDYLDWVRDETR